MQDKNRDVTSRPPPVVPCSLEHCNRIVNVLEDVRVNLEMVSEQKAVIDHAVENVATLDETLRAAQATLKSLRIERELAERIERGIKSLRTKMGTGSDESAEDSQTA